MCPLSLRWTPAELADPLALARALVACPSVTPRDAGALDVLEAALTALGFRCVRLPFGAEGGETVDNLYARRGEDGPCFGFAGHTDVVPAGDGWSRPPFGAEVVDGALVGRGAADMKGGIACFVAAVARLISGHDPLGSISGHGPLGSIALLITGDEEGPALHGTRKVLEWMEGAGERMDLCLVGEPTNPEGLGDMIKIGRRGSLTATITLLGRAGHVAYPHLADNPLHRLSTLTGLLLAEVLDDGTAHFQPSSLQLTSIDVGNPAANVIPAKATLRFNIRFNDRHSGESLSAWIRAQCLAACGGDESGFSLVLEHSGDAFLTPPGRLSDLIATACQAVTGRRPELSTSGGTSDARFIRSHCPVAEFGLVGRTMHKPDERVAVADLEALSEIYRRVLVGFFEAPC
ncbi:succinyl-diaminopimelate desuccinylase [Rhodospirillum rubrum]|uniref:succinyl-diaminopimelate desuccinylase n=1 Tax=Rhodospirillum rubrum TaxID=1085 RepID=UPI0019047BF2|nr:succinyl-diaminopimelate desuccinylase [Rhodospirillum rubrum]MBK1666140.1 succinyl-diaminopimelate desuccinylase [Rhodospirillum rubrum]MBK1678184.1 succinyl-diaminopimelate desuccinylase [Rhodospirillum rubrum]